MPIAIVTISDSDARKVLALGEGHFLDFKARQIRPRNLTKHISAFANADGGDLYIGIFEKSTSPVSFDWSGFYNAEDANAHVQIFEALFPLGVDYRYEFLTAPSLAGLVLHIEVRKTRGIVKTQEGQAYLRRGAQSLPVDTAEKLKTVERAKGLTSFESEPVSAPLDAISNSEAIIRFMLNVVPHARTRGVAQEENVHCE